MKKIILLLLTFLFLRADETFVEKSGSGLAVLLPLYNFAVLYSNEDTTGQIDFLKSTAAAVIVPYAMKQSIQETRPDRSDDHSFPSLHSAVAFNSAANLYFRYGFEESKYATLAACFVGFSRIYANKHYTHDVIAGGLLGIASSYVFTQRFESVDMSADYENGRYTFQISYNF